MPLAEVAGASLYFEEAGDGPPLLWITGSGSDLSQRPTVLDGPLPHRFRVVAYDHRGTGRSRASGEVTMERFAADAEALLDHLGWERARVIGISFGGMVAQELAIRAPDRVERLALLCTSSGGAGGASFPLHELESLSPEVRARRALALAETRVDEAWQDAHPGEAAPLLARVHRDTTPPGQAALLAARRHHDTFSRLHRIAAPTLVAGGRFDAIAPPANLEALAAGIPGAVLRFFDGGHLFVLQDPTALPVIADFLLAA